MQGAVAILLHLLVLCRPNDLRILDRSTAVWQPYATSQPTLHPSLVCVLNRDTLMR